MKSDSNMLFDLDDWSRSCSYKKAYDTEWQAKFAADETMARNKKLKLDWYFCKYCKKWHLTEV